MSSLFPEELFLFPRIRTRAVTFKTGALEIHTSKTCLAESTYACLLHTALRVCLHTKTKIRELAADVAGEAVRIGSVFGFPVIRLSIRPSRCVASKRRP
jgi:hypothetical protein